MTDPQPEPAERRADPLGADEPESQSGLGRGLSSIISELADLEPAGDERPRGGRAALLGAPSPSSPSASTEAIPPPASPPPDDRRRVAEHPHDAVHELRDDLVEALLEGLANTMRPDLCAYLHVAPPAPDRFFCLRPSLDALGPQRTYDLIDALNDQVRADRSTDDFTAAGLSGTAVLTRGREAVGLYAVSRAGGLRDGEHQVIDRFCRSFGRAVHRLDGADAEGAPTAAAEVTVHRTRDSVMADVVVHTGTAIRPGRGRAATRVEAITRAVIVAVGLPVTFRYASEASIAGEHAAVVLVEGQGGAVSLGSARSPYGDGTATAQAALQALDGLDHR